MPTLWCTAITTFWIQRSLRWSPKNSPRMPLLFLMRLTTLVLLFFVYFITNIAISCLKDKQLVLKYMFVNYYRYVFTVYDMIVYFCYLDNVCIESMSIKITRRTLDKCQQNIDGLSKQIQR